MEEMTTLFLDSVLGEKKPADGCPKTQGIFPAETPVGMAYVPFQFWEKTYDEPTALARGTIFPSLDKPFIGEEAASLGK
ncbi:MAG: spore coat associated protein CotJA [Ruminococcus sp.]|nr:spore coat associated protein CotJA [Ruminococcus sp.]